MAALDIEGMTIRTECFQSSLKWHGTADADARLFVRAFDLDAEEVLEIREFGGIGGHDEDVVVGLAQFCGDGKIGFGADEFGDELREFLLGDGGEFYFGCVEFSEERAQCVVIGACEFRELVVCGHVAKFLRAGCVVLIFHRH